VNDDRKKHRVTRTKLAALAASLVLLAVVLEIASRSVFPVPSPASCNSRACGKYIGISEGEYEVSMTYGRLGYRRPEVGFTKPEGEFRIVAIGDSFTEGTGVEDEEAWVQVAASELSKHGIEAKGVNLGQLATGPPGYHHMLHTMGFALHPDVVVVGICQNDGTDCRQWRGVPEVRLVESLPRPSGSALLRTLALLSRGVRPNSPLISVPLFAPVPSPANPLSEVDPQLLKTKWQRLAAAGRGGPHLVQMAIEEPDSLLRAATMSDPASVRGLELGCAVLTRMADACAERGLPVVAVYLPYEWCYCSRPVAFLAELGFDVRVIPPPRDVVRDRMRGWAERTGIAFVDTTVLSRCHADSYYTRDGHPTATGHRRIGAAVAAEIQHLVEKKEPAGANADRNDAVADAGLAVQQRREESDQKGLTAALIEQSRCALAAGDATAACKTAREALELSRRLDLTWHESVAMEQLAHAEAVSGRADAARRLIEQSLRLARAAGDRRTEVSLSALLAAITERDNAARAVRLWARAACLARSHGLGRDAHDAALRAYGLLTASGHHEEALCAAAFAATQSLAWGTSSDAGDDLAVAAECASRLPRPPDCAQTWAVAAAEMTRADQPEKRRSRTDLASRLAGPSGADPATAPGAEYLLRSLTHYAERFEAMAH